MESVRTAFFQSWALIQQLKSSVCVTDTKLYGKVPICASFILDTEDTSTLHGILLPFPPSLGLMWLQILSFFSTTHQKWQMGCAVAFHSGEGMVKGLREKSLLQWYWETVWERRSQTFCMSSIPCAGNVLGVHCHQNHQLCFTLLFARKRWRRARKKGRRKEKKAEGEERDWPNSYTVWTFKLRNELRNEVI